MRICILYLSPAFLVFQLLTLKRLGFLEVVFSGGGSIWPPPSEILNHKCNDLETFQVCYSNYQTFKNIKMVTMAISILMTSSFIWTRSFKNTVFMCFTSKSITTYWVMLQPLNYSISKCKAYIYYSWHFGGFVTKW